VRPGRPAAPGRPPGQGAAGQRLPVDPVPLRAPAAGAAPARPGGGLAALGAVAQRGPAVQDRGVTPSFSLTAAVLGTPDPPGLARFYQRLLGWPIRDDEPEWATLRPADGSTGLSFQLETDHVPPVWPQEPGVQQMQLHLDLQVDFLDAACAAAEEA